MTTKEGVVASTRKGKSSILSPKSINEARPRRLDVPYCVGPITMKMYACRLY